MCVCLCVFVCVCLCACVSAIGGHISQPIKTKSGIKDTWGPGQATAGFSRASGPCVWGLRASSLWSSLLLPQHSLPVKSCPSLVKSCPSSNCCCRLYTWPTKHFGKFDADYLPLIYLCYGECNDRPSAAHMHNLVLIFKVFFIFFIIFSKNFMRNQLQNSFQGIC